MPPEADDQLFEQQNSDGEGDGDSDGKGNGDAATVNVDTSSIAQAVAGEFTPAFGEIGRAIKGLSDRMDQSEQARVAGSDDDDPNLEIQEFLRDPDAKITAKVEEGLQKQGPLWDAVLAGKREDHFRDQKSLVDDRFGDGAWDEHFNETVRAIVGKYPAQFQLESAGAASAVAQVIGQKYETLRDLETTHTKKAEKANRDYKSIGSSRGSPRKPTLSDEESEFIDELRRAGVDDVSEELYMKQKAMPLDHGGWKKAQGRK